MAHATPRHARFVIIALLGYSAFSLADAGGKWLTQYYSTWQIMAMEGGIALPLLLLCAPVLGGVRSILNTRHTKGHVVRAVLSVGISIGVLYCFAHLPLVAFYTAVFTWPMMAALLAKVFYKERIGPTRAAAIALGFLGVLVAFRPDTNPQILTMPAFWVAIVLTVPIAGMLIVARTMEGASSLAFGFWPCLATALVGGAMAIPDWTPVPLTHWPIICVLAAGVAFGTVALALAFRSAPAGLVAPFVYIQILWGLGLGWMIFGDMPNGWMLFGAGIIIMSGIYVIETERRTNVTKENSG